MGNEILVSLVVPVYNVFPYLEECLQSLVRQTLQEIEIICVDDASTDGSGEMLARYAEEDPRIRLIRLPANSSACVARARGVKASRGKYIMFVDPDDYLDVNACRELAGRIRKAGCDMLHFTTKVIGDDANGARGIYVNHMVNPREKSVDGDLVTACFEEKKFGFQLWNKIYRGDLVRKAMESCPEEYLPKAQDLLAFFMIAYEAKSYRSQQTEPMYYYRMGVGVTGGRYLTRDQLRKSGLQLQIPGKITAFLKKKNDEERYRDVVRLIENRLMEDSLSKLAGYTYSQDKAYGWAEFCKNMPEERLVESLAARYFGREEQGMDLVKLIRRETRRPERIRTIGTFYPRLKNGGIQRVMAQLTEVWTKSGYRVIVITEEAQENEYDLPEGAVRRCLPAFDGLDGAGKKTHAAERMSLLRDLVRNEHIDLFITHQWLSNFMLWDMLAVQMSGAMFCIHCHSVFSAPLVNKTILHTYNVMPEIYRLADGVFVLSDTDQYYWSQYNSRVWEVVNPLPFEHLRTEPQELRNHRILWVGRLSGEKRPMDVAGIMEKVTARVPDAELIMVGGGEPETEQEIRRAVHEKGLDGRIRFEGFRKDVAPYYEEASVYLSTSEFEGFSVSIGEAQIYGMPVVGYDLFYLSLLEQKKGCLLAPIGRTDILAEHLIRLLTSPEEYREISAEALENIGRFNVDLEEQWRTIFRDMTEKEQISEPDPRGRTTLDTIRQQATLKSEWDGMSDRERKFIALEMAFPMPQTGPMKGFRRKAALLSRVLLIDGFQSVFQRIRVKKNAG